VIRSKRCIPNYANLSALDLHQRLQNQQRIMISPIPLANAVELKQAIETHGFFVNIRNV
jgi:hypothetical protein